MNEVLKEIGERLRTQDNRCTTDPCFCVQVLERIGPLQDGHASLTMFHNSWERETYYEDVPDPKRWLELSEMEEQGVLPDYIEMEGYREMWKTVQVCFTLKGAEQHLEINGHNYRHYYGTQIYVDSFYRNPEMQAIREWLMGDQ